MENYNKFIMATDTIGRMKVKFQEMESKVLQLSSNIKSINKSAKEIGSCLEPNRKRLNELVNVQQALSQLQFIFSLPKKLENFIDSNEYDQAYELYMESKPVLEKYRNHASFEKTVIHIDILIGKLQTKIFTEKIIPNFKNPKKEDLLKLNDISVHSNQYINLKTTSTEIVAVREILDLVNENLPIAENIAKFNISNGEQVLTSLLDKFETMVIILTNIESIDAVNLTEFCQQFFIRLCEHLEKLDDNIFNVYMIRIVYQRLLDCGDSPNLPPLVNTQELAEKLCISKVRQILSTYDLSLDNNYSNFSGRDLCLNYSMIPGTNLTSQQIYRMGLY